MNNEQFTRLVSLDVFRGLTIAGMILVNNPGSWSHVYGPLRHAEWHGWKFADLVFPFFLFIVGVAVALALGRRLETGVRKRFLYIKIIRRTLILFVLGIFLNGFPFFELSTLRIPGVLQRIAICYLITTVIFLNSTWKGQLAWAVGLLLAYWAVMEWMPVPGIGGGMYEKGSNLAAYVDGLFLKGHMWSVTKTWDPEGLVSTIPAISTTLFGVLTGQWLRGDKPPLKKAVWLFAVGAAGIFIGSLWHILLPINKSLWTSSYSILTAGLALICLGICYFIIDVRGSKKWIQPALVYGMNAIAVYVLAGIVARLLYVIKVPATDGNTMPVKAWVYNNLFATWLGATRASLAYAVVFIVVLYLFMLILYRKKIFIKI
jgi:predicted acyltransferase